MIPAGLVHDRHSRVLIRGDRAARLSPFVSNVVATLIAGGGAAATARLTSPEVAFSRGYRRGSNMRAQLRAAAGSLAWIGLAIVVHPDGETEIIDLEASTRRAA